MTGIVTRSVLASIFLICVYIYHEQNEKTLRQTGKSEEVFKGNAQFVQKVTFEPLINFKQNHYGSWKYYKSCYF